MTYTPVSEVMRQSTGRLLYCLKKGRKLTYTFEATSLQPTAEWVVETPAIVHQSAREGWARGGK